MNRSNQQESHDEAMSCAQIEFDKLCFLYKVGCESDTAGDNMISLCAAYDVDYELLKNFSPDKAPVMPF